MSTLGQTRPSGDVRVTSAFLSIATTMRTSREVGSGPEAEVAVIRSVELIVQSDAKDTAGVVASGPAKRIIIENSLPRPIRR
jgi:hypothetical protein